MNRSVTVPEGSAMRISRTEITLHLLAKYFHMSRMAHAILINSDLKRCHKNPIPISVKEIEVGSLL
jgi:hypothetical protein